MYNCKKIGNAKTLMLGSRSDDNFHRTVCICECSSVVIAANMQADSYYLHANCLKTSFVFPAQWCLQGHSNGNIRFHL